MLAELEFKKRIESKMYTFFELSQVFNVYEMSYEQVCQDEKSQLSQHVSTCLQILHSFAEKKYQTVTFGLSEKHTKICTIFLMFWTFTK